MQQTIQDHERSRAFVGTIGRTKTEKGNTPNELRSRDLVTASCLSKKIFAEIGEK
jgi:hypothetical protein